MRALGIFAVVVMAACSAPEGPTASNPSPTPGASTPAAAVQCRLPVWWAQAGAAGQPDDIHAGFVSAADGHFTDAGSVAAPAGLPNNLASFQFDSAAWVPSRQTWVRASRNLVSPDGTSYVYWTNDSTGAQIHLTNASSGADRVIYNGATLFLPIAFEADGIYLVHGINLRQSAFEKLYRLDPNGGTPQLVAGSDRHMYQYGWLLVSDGAAWGIDNRVDGNTYFYSVLRLDLATNQVTQWFEGPADQQFWPEGVDAMHRLYIAHVSYSNGESSKLLLLDQPGHAVELADPGTIAPNEVPGGSPTFSADGNGVWFGGVGGVWWYRDGQTPKQFLVGPADAIVAPAGACL